jgi:ABC-2 type transport system permease protein/oleandomycin transport system permease protein
LLLTTQYLEEADRLTITVNALRALTYGGPTTRVVLQSLAWIVGILVVFVPLAVNRYRRAAG